MTAAEHGRQGVADCLRARDRDPCGSPPNIRPGPIALQGTSLGGFVAATAGGVDQAFDPVILLISGGDGYSSLHAACTMRQPSPPSGSGTQGLSRRSPA
ncbi:MAG: hypothetical protein R3C45_13630 [Phycisphaerales bacterium]